MSILSVCVYSINFTLLLACVRIEAKTLFQSVKESQPPVPFPTRYIEVSTGDLSLGQQLLGASASLTWSQLDVQPMSLSS